MQGQFMTTFWRANLPSGQQNFGKGPKIRHMYRSIFITDAKDEYGANLYFTFWNGIGVSACLTTKQYKVDFWTSFESVITQRRRVAQMDAII